MLVPSAVFAGDHNWDFSPSVEPGYTVAVNGFRVTVLLGSDPERDGGVRDKECLELAL